MDKEIMLLNDADAFIVAKLINAQEAEVHLGAKNPVQQLQLFNAVCQSLIRDGYEKKAIELAFAAAMISATK